MYNFVDDITKETEIMAKAKEISEKVLEAKLSAGIKQPEAAPIGEGLLSTMNEIKARVESA